jgi:hypothetical protein
MDIIGLAPDELQLHAEELIERQEQQDREYEREFLRKLNQRQPIAPQQAYIDVSWFPPDQYQRALENGPASPRTTSTDPTRRTARDSSCYYATSNPRASNDSRSRRSRSMTTSRGAPSTTAMQSNPTPERATPPSWSQQISSIRGHQRETSRAVRQRAQVHEVLPPRPMTLSDGAASAPHIKPKSRNSSGCGGYRTQGRRLK